MAKNDSKRKEELMNHRAFNLYKSYVDSVEAEGIEQNSNSFNNAVKVVANKMNIGMVEAKEAIYAGYSAINGLSYEEGKTQFKSLHDNLWG